MLVAIDSIDRFPRSIGPQLHPKELVLPVSASLTLGPQSRPKVQNLNTRNAKSIALGLAATLLLLALTSASAFASKSQLSIIEDPSRAMSPDKATRDASLDETKALGADFVKLPVTWRTYAPDGASTTKPTIDLKDPSAYPAGTWDVLDSAIAGAQERKLKVWLMITAPAPRWAVSQESAPGLGAYLPDPAEYADFVTAVGRRYSGVHYFSFWNEVNLKRYMQPQYKSGVVQSAIHYRDMYRAAYSALGASGHRSDTILFGELLPRYQTYSPSLATRPLTWLRTFFCIDSKGKALKGAAASKNKCAGFKSLKSSGLAYHPYNAFNGPLALETASKDNASIGYLSRVEKLLDQAYKAKHLSTRKLKIYNSEYGFQTDPPDDTLGNPIGKVPFFLNASEYLNWTDPRVATYSQYLLVDDPDESAFQSGLRFVDGSKKEAIYAAFQTPFMVFKGRTANQVSVWGCLRAKKSGTTSAKLEVKSGSKWTTVKSIPVSTSNGYFAQTVTLTGAKSKVYRVSWSGGISRFSRPGTPIAMRTN
jgi:hypothetical protein